MMKRSTLFHSLIGIALLLLSARQARAATFTIANGDVAALKNAIVTSNTNQEDDTINLAAGGIYILTSVDNTVDGPNGLPLIDADIAGNLLRSLTINGNGATIMRSAAGGTPFFRILYFSNYFLDRPERATLSNLTLTNGVVVSGNPGAGDGGAIFVADGKVTLNNCTISDNFAGNRGGAIYNGNGQLAVNNCTLNGNEGHETGGAIHNFGELIMSSCTISNNETVLGPGGAINNTSLGDPATATLTNCTIINNFRPDGGGLYGDGVFNNAFSQDRAAQAQVILSNCTVSGNDVLNAGTVYTGGPFPDTTNTTLRNTILNDAPLVKNTPAGDTYNTITSEGYNLSTDNGGGFLTATGDQINSDPKLDPRGLQNNGGPTQTIALMEGSPALDKGENFDVTTDQRGQIRPRDLAFVANAPGGDGSDIGAFESIDPIQTGPTFTVNSAVDQDDGLCGVVNCRLREAIAAANAASDANTIVFAANVTGTIGLTAALGQLIITTPTTIAGPGARVLAVSGGAATRVFNFSGGSSFLSGLTIRDGASAGFSFFPALGGGLSNYGTLTVSDCAFIGNQASAGTGSSAGDGGGSASGGAVYNLFGGTLTLNNCTFSANSAFGGRGADNSGQGNYGGPGGTAQGGALFNDSGCTLALNNCTFSNNIVTGGAGGDNFAWGGGNGGAANGAGVSNQGTMTMTACTLSGNTGTGGAGGLGSGGGGPNNGVTGAGRGGLTANGGTSTVSNTLCAGNTGSAAPDASGAFTSGGYNLVGNGTGSTGFTATGDQVGVNAQLGTLQNNGGPTDTMALLLNNPALDKGKSFGLTTDERGVVRPIDDPSIVNASGGDGSDIGAFELDPSQSGATLIVTSAADRTDSVCGLIDCTLREAITAANSLAGNNSITFAPVVTGIIPLTTALPNLSTNIVVQGPGANLLTVRNSNNGPYRIFTISNGTAAGPTVSISGLTIADGFAFGDYGGGILNDHASLTVSDCAFTGNQATNGGGGLLNDAGTLTLRNSTFSGNSAAFGGGLYSRSLVSGTVATATVTNSTFSGNSATNNTTSNRYGGGVLNAATSNGSATLTVLNSTLAGNSAANGLGGALHNRSTTGGTATVSLGSTLFKAGSTGSNIVNDMGTITSQGYNLSSDPPTGPYLTQPTDRTNLNPLIGALANNGGPTQTHALQTSSPAIDTGKTFSLTTDQRGAPRPVDAIFGNASGGDGSDIGAVEMNLLGGPDSDGDGLSDDFEAFFGVSDPNGDADGDGLTNLDEFKAGTNPLDASSGLRITNVTREGNDFVVKFGIALAGKSYRLERKDSLTDASWSSIPGVPDLIAPSTGSAEITDTGGASVAKHFYHIRVLP